MSAKIPQDVTREDRLVGPLTLKQFLYVLGGGGVTFIFYRLYLQGYLYLIEFAPIAFVVVLFTLAMAFGSINGRPFGIFLINLWTYLWSTKLTVWQKEDIKDESPKLKVAHDESTNAPLPTKDLSESNLEKLAHVLDAGGRMNEDTTSSNRIGHLASNPVQPETSDVQDILNEVDEA